MNVGAVDVGAPINELVLIDAQRGNVRLNFNQIDTSWHAEAAQRAAPVAAPASQPEAVDAVRVARGPQAPLRTGIGNRYVSTTGVDSGECLSSAAPCLTINYAIGQANAGETINVADGIYRGSSGTNAVVTLSKSVNLSGGWDIGFSTQLGSSVIDGQQARGGVTATSGAIVTMERFTIRNGSGSSGAGIFLNGGQLTLENTTLTGNGGVRGGAIWAYGTLMIRNSTIMDNAATLEGGGIYRSGTTNLTLQNSILARNFSYGDGPDCYGTINTSDHSLIGDTSGCTIVSSSGGQVGVDPQTTRHPIAGRYYAPMPGSPALDIGNPATCLTVDQRGLSRAGTCDAGSYEDAVPGPAAAFGVNSADNQRIPALHPLQEPLAVYVVDSAGSPVGGTLVTFEAPNSGASGTFAATGNEVESVLTDQDGLAIATTFTTNGNLGDYTVAATASGLAGTAEFVLTNFAWFVSMSGNDANSCADPAATCLTINGAIAKATPGDWILVAEGTYTGIGGNPMHNAVVDIPTRVHISGGWNDDFTVHTGFSTIDGQHIRRGIYGGAGATLNRLIITNGEPSGGAGGDWGGGIYAAGDLTIDDSLIINNEAGKGGGIHQSSSGSLLSVNNSTIEHNFARTSGGGISQNFGSFVVNNSTIALNQAGSGSGGGISAEGSFPAQLHNSAVVYNTAQYEGGAYFGGGPSTNIRLTNTVLFGNNATAYPDCGGYIRYSSHNIYGGSQGCAITTSQGDLFGTDPMLAEYPVGEPPYFVLLPGSPAIDAGSDCLSTDQRGVSRPQGAACDIGPFEYTSTVGAASHVGISAGANQRAAPGDAFTVSFAAFVVDDQGNPAPGVSVIFTAPNSGASGTFATTGTNSTAVDTDFGGIAMPGQFTANSELGAYGIHVAAVGVPESAELPLANAAWFVAPGGSDGNSCALPAAPCRTIDGAHAKALTGDTINVAGGTYTGTGQSVANIFKSTRLVGGWDPTFALQSSQTVIDGGAAGEDCGCAPTDCPSTYQTSPSRTPVAYRGPRSGSSAMGGALHLNGLPSSTTCGAAWMTRLETYVS